VNADGGVLKKADILYMDTKAMIVQILRTFPAWAGMTGMTGTSSTSSITGGTGNYIGNVMDLDHIADMASTCKDGAIVPKGLKVKEMLQELRNLNVISRSDNYKLMVEELNLELAHLGNLKETVNKETKSLHLVLDTITEHNTYLRAQLESYKAYLQNVRNQSGNVQSTSTLTTLSLSKSGTVKGPYKFSHGVLDKDGTILESNVPDNRKASISFWFVSPTPGTFIIALHFKGTPHIHPFIRLIIGRDKAILEMDLKLDDLLEKQQMGVLSLDLEYVKFSIPKIITLLNKTFLKK
jgi:Ras GTPase-activating-like protein IQGAP2/3